MVRLREVAGAAGVPPGVEADAVAVTVATEVPSGVAARPKPPAQPVRPVRSSAPRKEGAAEGDGSAQALAAAAQDHQGEETAVEEERCLAAQAGGGGGVPCDGGAGDDVRLTGTGLLLPLMTTVLEAVPFCMNWQAAFAGRLLQVLVKVPVYPPTGRKVSMEVPVLPAWMVREVGLAVMVYPGVTFEAMVTVMGAVVATV